MSVQPAPRPELDALRLGTADDKIEVMARLRGRTDSSYMLEHLLGERASRVAQSPLVLEPADVPGFRERLWDIARRGAGARLGTLASRWRTSDHSPFLTRRAGLPWCPRVQNPSLWSLSASLSN